MSLSLSIYIYICTHVCVYIITITYANVLNKYDKLHTYYKLQRTQKDSRKLEWRNSSSTRASKVIVVIVKVTVVILIVIVIVIVLLLLQRTPEALTRDKDIMSEKTAAPTI